MGDQPAPNALPQPGAPPTWNDRALPNYPGLRQSIALTLITAASLIVVGIVVAATAAALALELPTGVEIAATNTIAVGLVVLWGCRRTGARNTTVLRFAPFPPLLVAPLVLLTLGSSIVLSEIDNLLRTILPIPQLFSEALLDLHQEGWGNLVALIVVAPLTEELLFRGLILRGLIAERGEWAAVLYSSLFFGLLHLNPWQLPSAFVLGIVLGWLFIRSRSLLPCILLHALFNFLSFALGSSHAEVWGIAIPGYTGAPIDPVVYQPLPFDLLGLLLAVGSLAWIRRALDPPRSGTERQ
jgi:membrane protease YdiL (CAAX protease family)